MLLIIFAMHLIALCREEYLVFIWLKLKLLKLWHKHATMTETLTSSEIAHDHNINGMDQTNSKCVNSMVGISLFSLWSHHWEGGGITRSRGRSPSLSQNFFIYLQSNSWHPLICGVGVSSPDLGNLDLSLDTAILDSTRFLSQMSVILNRKDLEIWSLQF